MRQLIDQRGANSAQFMFEMDVLPGPELGDIDEIELLSILREFEDEGEVRSCQLDCSGRQLALIIKLFIFMQALQPMVSAGIS